MKVKLLFAIMIVIAAVGATGCNRKNETPEVPEELYNKAIIDAAFADEDEILPLVSLAESDPMTTWKDEKVLLLTWHNYPDSYPVGEKVIIEWGPVWTFTDKEIASHSEELKGASNPEMRMKQLVGFAPDSEHSTVTGMWVDIEDVKRPAYQTDPTAGYMTTDFGDDIDEEYKAWFDENILWSYYYGAFPWTRLGYTYDWADNGKEYGLTEFIVQSGAEVTVAFTEATDDFLNRIS